MLRFLHLADLHLDAKPSYLGQLARQRNEDFLNAFKRAIDFAIDPKNEVHAIIIAGDLFDCPNPDIDTLKFTIAQFKRLQNEFIPVVLVPGNHDALGGPKSIFSDPGSELRRLVHFIDSPKVECNFKLKLNGEEVFFYGMAWDVHRSVPPFDQFQASSEQGFHIAVLHGTLDSALFTEAHSRDVPLNLSNLSKTGMDYIALGHIHNPQDYDAAGIPVVYPGNLEAKRMTAGETGERRLVVVTLDHKQRPSIESIPWNQRTTRKEKLDLNQEVVESELELASLIREKFGAPDVLMDLELSGAAPFIIDVDGLQTRLSGDFYWLQVTDNSEIFDSLLIQSWAHEQTIRGLFVRNMVIMKDQEKSEAEQAKIDLALKLTIQAFEKSLRD